MMNMSMKGYKGDKFLYSLSCLICKLLIFLVGINACEAMAPIEDEGGEGDVTRYEARISENEKAAEEFLKIMIQIDEKFPGPNVPVNNETYSIIAITDSNEFVVDGGLKVELAGIDCDESAARKFRTLFTSPKDKVRFQEIQGTDSARVTAYVWLVDYDFEKTPESGNVGFGPAFLSVNEIALLEGWCNPSQDVEHRFLQRFRILNELGVWSRQGGKSLPTVQH